MHLRTLLQRVEASKWLLTRQVRCFRAPKWLPSAPMLCFRMPKWLPGAPAQRVTGAQVAPEHACAAFYRVFTCFLEPSGYVAGSMTSQPSQPAVRTNQFFCIDIYRYSQPLEGQQKSFHGASAKPVLGNSSFRDEKCKKLLGGSYSE